jgi:hypothetical protein
VGKPTKVIAKNIAMIVALTINGLISISALELTMCSSDLPEKIG